MRVLVSGIFDLFHYGHMLLIKKCRYLYPNDTLIVGIHSDEECTNYKRQPIFDFNTRKKTIEIFGIQDEVIECPLKETKDFYNKYKIDLTIHAHSSDDHEFYIKNCYTDAVEMGIFKRLDYTSEISTSEIINKIKSS